MPIAKEESKKYVLITGGAGFIGSHTVLTLLQSNYECIVIDNLANSSRKSLERIEKISGKSVTFFNIDILDNVSLADLFSQYAIHSVIHFAGFKSVGESIKDPILYYYNNVSGTISLIQVMKKFGVKRMIFSSSATVYGDPKKLPLTESSELNATNPYGRSKLYIEGILCDLAKSDKEWDIISLRYFNPVGAHSSGFIGEDPKGIPNNLMPFVSQVAAGKLPIVKVFGNNYQTIDGTGMRDYVHVTDLAEGHLAALKCLKEKCGYRSYNLGTGKAYSVINMIQTMAAISGKEIPFQVVEPRQGDAAVVFADCSLAQKELDWKAQKTLEDMCKDLWNWQSKNPFGYNEN